MRILRWRGGTSSTTPRALYRLPNDTGPLWSSPYRNWLCNNLSLNTFAYIIVSIALIYVGYGQLNNTSKQASLAERQATLAGKQVDFAEEQLKLAKEERAKAQEALQRASQAEQMTKSLENLVQQARVRILNIQSTLETMARQSEALESTARQTTEKLESVIVQAQSAEQRLRDAEERESLRQWAMVVPTGEIATDIMGLQLKSSGTLTKRYQEIFVREESTIKSKDNWCSKEHYKRYINNLNSLIKDYPKVPYAYVLLALCLKEHDDPSWRAETERAKQVLEKLMTIQAHVITIDGYYALLVRDLLGLDIGKTGYFDVHKDGTYIPIGMPH